MVNAGKTGYISISDSNQSQQDLLVRTRSAERDNEQLRILLEEYEKRARFMETSQIILYFAVGMLVGLVITNCYRM